jgi:hypothetical protein
MTKLNFEAELGAGVGDGWVPIVEDLYIALKALDPTLVVKQVKEKFGTLRFYFRCEEDRYDELAALVYKAEAKCAQTCEMCGSTENVECKAGESGWVKTLCAKCRVPWNEGKRPWDGDWPTSVSNTP